LGHTSWGEHGLCSYATSCRYMHVVPAPTGASVSLSDPSKRLRPPQSGLPATSGNSSRSAPGRFSHSPSRRPRRAGCPSLSPQPVYACRAGRLPAGLVGLWRAGAAGEGCRERGVGTGGLLGGTGRCAVKSSFIFPMLLYSYDFLIVDPSGGRTCRRGHRADVTAPTSALLCGEGDLHERQRGD
jgi:hypothetical protein